MKWPSLMIATVALASTSTATTSFAALSTTEDVKVWVNGVKINFGSAKPKTIVGHLMIPLRGVLEEMGAKVDWNEVTKTASVVKDKKKVELLIGTDVAKVDGEEVEMEISARLVDGTVYVPLRFVGEELGADVSWIPTTQTVRIFASESEANDNTRMRPVMASGLSSSASSYIGAGFPIDYTLRGTPGGAARLWIPGVAGPTALKELEPGIYTGTWLAPPAGGTAPVILNGVTAIASVRAGGSESYVQIGSPAFIDTAPPIILLLIPYGGVRWPDPTPIIAIHLDDGAGSGVDSASIKVLLDGNNVTTQAEVSANSVRYTPDYPLTGGSHNLTVTAADNAQNAVTRNYNFYVGSSAPSIQSFLVDAPADAEPGMVMDFTLNGVAGGIASYSIGDKRMDLRMAEVSPGLYRGQYTVRDGDDFFDEPVVARLRSNVGDDFAIAADFFVSTTRNLGSVEVNSPANGAKADQPLVIRGSALAGRRVRLHVEYSTTFGAAPFTGALADMQVVADATGSFESPVVNLDTLPLGKNSMVKVTAYVVGSDGRKSTPVTVEAKLGD